MGRWTYGYGAILSKDIGSLALANSPITPPLAYPNTKDIVPIISGNGFSTLTEFGPYDNFSYKHNFAGDMTLIRGNHTIKFGGQYSYLPQERKCSGGKQPGTIQRLPEYGPQQRGANHCPGPERRGGRGLTPPGAPTFRILQISSWETTLL